MKFNGKTLGSAAISNVMGQTTIVAAPGAGRAIIVVGYHLSLDGAGEYQWHSGSTALTGAVELAADTPDAAQFLACGANEALKLTCTGAPGNGHVSYYIEMNPGSPS